MMLFYNCSHVFFLGAAVLKMGIGLDRVQSKRWQGDENGTYPLKQDYLQSHPAAQVRSGALESLRAGTISPKSEHHED